MKTTKLIFSVVSVLLISCGINTQHKETLSSNEDSFKTVYENSSYTKPKLSQPEFKEKTSKKGDNFIGTYFCNRTHDTYYFDEDGTGYFKIQSIDPTVSEFKWVRKGKDISITFTGEATGYGKLQLKYNMDENTITENTQDFGVLIFNKK
jgi:lipoprotein